MADKSIEVFLIPGFFGFANLGEFRYFEHVRVALGDALGRRGVRASIHDVRTLPTASLRERALRVARAIEEQDPAGEVHLVCHSAGGLDARLLVSPGVDLGRDADVEGVASRVRSVVTVSTPHHGTPVATAFHNPSGRQLLRLISLATIYVVRENHLPRSVVRQFVELVTQLDKGKLVSYALLDEAFRELLESFEPEQQRELQQYFEGVAKEQDLLPQLSPPAVEMLNATIRERDGVRAGCVVSRARPPRLLGMAGLGLDAYAQSMYALYRWLHGQASLAEDTRVPMDRATRDALQRGYGEVPKPRANDGIVPTWSQVWGEVIHAASADHLDVIGHFDGPDRSPPHFDWLPSGTDFGPAEFRAMWADVAGFLTR